MRCVRCGGPIGQDGTICMSCGQRYVPHMTAPRRSKSGWWVALALLGCLAAGAVVGEKMGIKVPGASALHEAQSAVKRNALDEQAAPSRLVSMADQGSTGPTTLQDQGDGAAAAILGADASGGPASLGDGASSGPSTLETDASASPGGLTVQAQANPPTMAQTKGMPADVLNWLKHLQRCEQAREQLASDELAAGAKLLGVLQAGEANDALSPDEARDGTEKRTGMVSTDANSMKAQWAALQQRFDSVPAPAECASLKGHFDTVLGNTAEMITQIVSAIANAAQDPQGALAVLAKMRGTSDDQIDAPAKTADGELGAICAKYQTDKWFSIQADVGGGLMSQIGY